MNTFIKGMISSHLLKAMVDNAFSYEHFLFKKKKKNPCLVKHITSIEMKCKMPLKMYCVFYVIVKLALSEKEDQPKINKWDYAEWAERSQSRIGNLTSLQRMLSYPYHMQASALREAYHGVHRNYRKFSYVLN